VASVFVGCDKSITMPAQITAAMSYPAVSLPAMAGLHTTRTDRLYALVEELRAVAPRPRSGSWLAARFEVSTRTIERDIAALQDAGVPIWADPGRSGGYVLDKRHTLPPVNVSPAEAVAIAVGLEHLRGSPFHEAARAALGKLLAVLPPGPTRAAVTLADRVRVVQGQEQASVPAAVSRALSAGRVLRLRYLDRHGVASEREVEPMAYLGGDGQWYLLAWCRLRGAVRGFRIDRIVDPVATDEPCPPRELHPGDLALPANRPVTPLLG
jgi:predicted DNA-binding transcriptional regulator YafY